MQEGIACGNGWFSILEKLSNEIETIANQMSVAGYADEKLPIALQVKEKFGGLRFYMANQTSDIRALIQAATQASFLICEICGEDGEGSNDEGWYSIACEACKAKQK